MTTTDLQISGFTRQEAIILSSCTSSRLAYLEKVGLIIPYRFGLSKKPVVFFSWEQLIGLRIIQDLRLENVSLQTVKNVIDILEKDGYDDNFKDKKLISVDSNVFWIHQDWYDFGFQFLSEFKDLGRSGKIEHYNLLVFPSLINVVSDIWDIAKHSELIDYQSFRQRAKVKQLT